MENLKAKTHSDKFNLARRRMIDRQLVARGITDPKVLKVMGDIPRHLFVEEALAEQSYGDYPVGIGEGQTISQPYIVAMMTQSLQLKGNEKILEIGTGCGYQTSVLASLAGQIYTIERIKNLAFKARRVLKELGYKNVVMRVGDGTQGWPEAKPFDGILIAAASPVIPKPLFNQLSEGGRMLVPIGDEENQDLIRITRIDGKPKVENLGPCRFVKLVGKFGFDKRKLVGDGFQKRSRIIDEHHR